MYTSSVCRSTNLASRLDGEHPKHTNTKTNINNILFIINFFTTPTPDFPFPIFSYLCVNRLPMTTKDLRKEIGRVIQQVPDDFLSDVLSYLKQIEKKSVKDIVSFKHLKKIFKEDQELLEKLAK